MVCRISACVIFFAPAMGLFNLLGHWKRGNINFASDGYLIFDVAENGTLINVRDIWKPIKIYDELTHYQLDVFYIVFLLLLFVHFIIVAIIKIKCSKEFKSRKEYLKKMLHILHQGNSNICYA
jgi:hypothetical protein